MSPRKIIFFAILGILIVAIMFGGWKMSQVQNTPSTVAKKLTIWVVGDSSEWFTPIVDGFKLAHPEYKKTTIEIVKFGSYEDYHKTLLSVLADGKGPDIFVIDAGKDDLLESKIEPIPEWSINIDDFYKRFDKVFFTSLITEVTSETDKTKTTYLKGIPLGYETMGIFYNKSAYPTFPKTWVDLDLLYSQQQEGVLPAGLGMSPRYIQNGTDLISLFLSYNKVQDYKSLENGSKGVKTFLSYTGESQTTSTLPEWDSSTGKELPKLEGTTALKSKMIDQNITMTDLFVRGEVGMIFWYPSLIREIEYAKKRAGDGSHSDIILTAPMLQVSLDSPKKTIARYSYFAVSKASTNKGDALKFLEFLTTEWAEAKYLEAFPYYLGAQTSFHARQADTALSTSFTRAKMGSFIQDDQENVIFHYGVWSTYQDWLYKIIDRNNNLDINKALSSLAKQIQCEIDQTLYQVGIWTNCSNILE